MKPTPSYMPLNKRSTQSTYTGQSSSQENQQEEQDDVSFNNSNGKVSFGDALMMPVFDTGKKKKKKKKDNDLLNVSHFCFVLFYY